MVHAGGEHSQAINLSLPAPDPISSFSILLHVLAFWPPPNAEISFLLPEAREKAAQHTLMRKFLALAMFSTCQSKSAAMCHPSSCLRQCLWGHKMWQALEQPLTALVCILSHSPCYCQDTLRQKPLSNQDPNYWHIMSATTANGRFWNSDFFPLHINALFPLLSVSTSVLGR